MMPYNNTKAKVCALDGDADFFDIVTGVLQGDTLDPYLSIICQDNILWTSIDLIACEFIGTEMNYETIL